MESKEEVSKLDHGTVHLMKETSSADILLDSGAANPNHENRSQEIVLRQE